LGRSAKAKIKVFAVNKIVSLNFLKHERTFSGKAEFPNNFRC